MNKNVASFPETRMVADPYLVVDWTYITHKCLGGCTNPHDLALAVAHLGRIRGQFEGGDENDAEDGARHEEYGSPRPRSRRLR